MFSNSADNDPARAQRIEDRQNNYEALQILTMTLINMNAQSLTSGDNYLRDAIRAVAKRIADAEAA